MKVKIPINVVIFAVILLFILVFYVGGRKNASSGQRKQEISQSAASTDQNISEIKITAKKFSFSPDIIKFKLNEKVRLRFASEDVVHGFSLPEFNINVVIQPGKETVVDFHASKKGGFTFLCSIPCGSGHSAMRGTIIIE